MNEYKRILLFYLICIPIRIGLILLLYYFPYKQLSILTFLISFGFLYQFLIRKSKIGFFKGKVFWPRWFHFLTYLIASILLVIPDTKNYAYIALIVDVCFSVILYTTYKNIIFSHKKMV